MEINHANTVIEMAHQYAKEHAKEEVKLPEQFKRHASLFSDKEANKFPPSQPWDHKIDLTADAPASFNCKVYPMLQKEQEAEDKFLDENLAKGYIVPSESPYEFSTFMVPKKDSDEKQYIIDYQPLNAITRKDVTPLPNLAQCIEDLQGMELFSKFDVQWGYNNIWIRDGDQWKGAFKTRRGLFEPKVMFFGMCNSPAAFQQFMNAALKLWYQKYGRKKGKNYMDDIAIATLLTEIDLHIAMVDDLFDILAAHGLHLKLLKSVFLQPQMDFLGIHINKNGVTVNPAKIAGLWDYPRTLHTLKQVRGFLGCTGYHHMFCKDFSTIAAPFVWGKEQQEAQETIINQITNAPVLARPDPAQQFELETDASLIGTGAILYQWDPPITLPDGTQKPGPQQPCGFHSQSFTSTEQNYLIYDQEFLGVLQGLQCWSHLLKGIEKPVLVYTDHANLRYYQEPHKIRSRVAGYIPKLAQYHMVLEYKPGATNCADALSRWPDYEVEGNLDNEDITVLPEKYFCDTHTSICVIDWDSVENTLEQAIKRAQCPMQQTLKQWATMHNLTTIDGTH